VKCQHCPKEATVHLTEMVHNEKREIHLCQSCADSKELFQPPPLNLSAILQTLIGQHLGPQTDQLARLTCPSCGIKYMEFRAQGRLGCPHDYEVFRMGLEPLLQKIHRSARHQGKAPHRHNHPSGHYAELVELRRQLHTAVEAEAYEEAARLRDLLRQKEATDESG
jgi:protein arginine kinase activator